MKLEHIEGCVCDSLTIDGTETIDLDIADIKTAIKKAIDKVDDLGTLQSILMDIISTGDWEDLGTCDCCGDIITKYTLEI